MLLVDTNSQLTLLSIHPSKPLTAEIVTVRSKWRKVCTSHLELQDSFKSFLILFCSAAFYVFLQECHTTLYTSESRSACIASKRNSDDVYLCFGGATLAAMLHSRYEKSKDHRNESILQQITILQRLNSYTKEHIPEYLKYRDNGYMYFPCTEMLTFLVSVDLKTKEMANEQSFNEHGSNLLKVAGDNIEKDRCLLSEFVELLVIKVPEINYMSLESMQNVFKELLRKLCHIRIKELLDLFKQKAVAQKGSAILSGINFRDSLLSQHVDLKSKC